MAWIRKRGRRYQVCWSEGDRSRAFTCPNRRAAEDVRREVEDAIGRGLRWMPENRRRRVDLPTIHERFLTESGRIHRPATTLRYAQHLAVFERYLRQRHGRRALEAELLTRSMLVDFITWLRAEPTGRHLHRRGEATVVKHVRAVQMVWRWAYDDDEDWPDQIPKPRALRMATPARPVTLAPTWAEMDAAVRAATGWRRQLAVVLRCTGLRVNQAMRLQWSDIDLDGAQIHIRAELGKSRAERSGRYMPLASVLVDELAGWGRREGWVIDAPRRVARARGMTKAWDAAGVPHDRRRQPHHAFRKGFQTELRRSGVSVDTLDFLVGHSRGLAAVYIAPEALAARAAVALVPPIGATASTVVPLPSRGSS